MSLEMHTYVPAIDESLVPRWLARMGELGMRCEIHPGFSFATHTGFLPFKLRIQNSSHAELNGVEFLTGFEYYIEDFSLEAELARQSPPPTLIGRLLGRNPPPKPYANAAIDAKLKACRKRLTFVWGSGDLFELRMATVSSAVLAELTGGISSYPADGIWYDKPAAAPDAAAEALAYENSVRPKDIEVHRFEQWL